MPEGRSRFPRDVQQCQDRLPIEDLLEGIDCHFSKRDFMKFSAEKAWQAQLLSAFQTCVETGQRSASPQIGKDDCVTLSDVWGRPGHSVPPRNQNCFHSLGTPHMDSAHSNASEKYHNALTMYSALGSHTEAGHR